MVKMIMSLPSHIDGEKFMELTMDVIKGRYGKDGYYNGVMPYASVIINPADVSNVYAKGFSGKNGLHYYEIDAEELDPVIIATLEEVGGMVGMKINFVTDGKFISQNWWRPIYADTDFHKKPYSEVVDSAREDYAEMLMMMNGNAYFEDGTFYKMA